MGQLNAAIAGYSDHIVDLECLCVYSGYYSGYYSNSRRPKSPASAIEKIIKAHEKTQGKRRSNSKSDVDIDAEVERFKRLEEKRLNGR